MVLRNLDIVLRRHREPGYEFQPRAGYQSGENQAGPDNMGRQDEYEDVGEEEKYQEEREEREERDPY